MVVRGHGLLNALSVHHNERDAIRKGPLFVRALVVKFRTLGEQVIAGRYDPESIVSLHLLDERDKRGSVARLAKVIAQFNQHPVRRDDVPLEAQHEIGRSRVQFVLFAYECDQQRRIGEDRAHCFGYP